MERLSSQLYVDGWDWVGIIGRRKSKGTFGANKVNVCFITRAPKKSLEGPKKWDKGQSTRNYKPDKINLWSL